MRLRGMRHDLEGLHSAQRECPVLSAITDPTVATRILRCLALPSRAPPLATSFEGGGPSESVEQELPDSILEFDFDQSRSSDDDQRSD